MICREIELTYKRAKKNSELKTVLGSASVREHCAEFFPMDKINLKEYFFVIYLNRGGKVLGVLKVGEGGTSSVIADVKLIMATALGCLASGIVLVHNHPGGRPCPSGIDDKLTRQVTDAARLFEIAVMDHIILTDGEYYSYADNGRI